MEPTFGLEQPRRAFYVAKRDDDEWIRISHEYKRRQDAVDALARLRNLHPEVRLFRVERF